MVDVVHVDHIRVRQPLGVVKLAPERLHTAGARRMRLHDLDGDQAVGDAYAGALTVPGLVYRGHAAPPQQLQQLIAITQYRTNPDPDWARIGRGGYGRSRSGQWRTGRWQPRQGWAGQWLAGPWRPGT